MLSDPRATLRQTAVFFLATTLTVAFPLVFGRVFWPDGLSAGAENLFWPASGVGTAGVLLLGRWQALTVFAATFVPTYFYIGPDVIAPAGNALEAFLAAEALRRFTPPTGRFARLHSVLVLVGGSLVAPLVSSLPGVAALVWMNNLLPPGEYWRGVVVWNLANATGIMVLVPAILALREPDGWVLRRHRATAVAWLTAGIVAMPVGFALLLRGDEANFAFLAFPFVLFAAVRFGPAETSLSLLLMVASVYVALATLAGDDASGWLARPIWFVQTFCWVLAATGLILAALTAGHRAAAEQIGREQTRALEAALRESQARLDALRYQINPHFLFNSLNSVREALPPEAEVSREMVTELADYLRGTLDQPEGHLRALRDEVRIVEQYLAIEKLRFGEELHVGIELDPAVASVPVPVYLLLPLAENAIRHGFETTKGRFRLDISAVRDGDRIRLELANTGVWREQSQRRGLGLENIRNRLQLLYGAEAALHCLCTDGWVRMRIELPVRSALPAANSVSCAASS